MACFAEPDINVSQGSGATYARCGGIFNIHLTTNLPRNLPVQIFFNSVHMWQNCGHESVAPLFWPTLYIAVGLTVRSVVSGHCTCFRSVGIISSRVAGIIDWLLLMKLTLNRLLLLNEAECGHRGSTYRSHSPGGAVRQPHALRI